MVNMEVEVKLLVNCQLQAPAILISITFSIKELLDLYSSQNNIYKHNLYSLKLPSPVVTLSATKFNIQQFYVMPTQRLFTYTALTGWFQDAFPTLRKAAISFGMYVRLFVRPSVCAHGRTRLPLGGFS